MKNIITFCKEFINNEEGLTVVEYVIGAAFLVVGLSLVFSGLGGQLSAKLNVIVSNMSDGTS